MKMPAMIAASFMGLAAAGAAELRYDRNLEKAAASIAASRMGDIRGGFSFRDKPQFVVVKAAPAALQDGAARDAAGQGRGDDGLLPAVERPFQVTN